MIGLRIAMVLWGGLSLTVGLFTTLFPGALDQIGRGVQNTFLLGSLGWLSALLGLGILLAARDPIRHILWVRIGLLSFFVGTLYDLVNLLIGTVELSTIALDVGAYILFALLFLVFYPRSPRMMPLRVTSDRGPLYTDADGGGLFIRRGRDYITYFIPATKRAVPEPQQEEEVEEGAKERTEEAVPPPKNDPASQDTSPPAEP